MVKPSSAVKGPDIVVACVKPFLELYTLVWAINLNTKRHKLRLCALLQELVLIKYDVTTMSKIKRFF